MPSPSPPLAAFAGGLASRTAPTIVRLVVLYLVARQGSVDDVGRVALAAAAAYLCGTLAEMGTMTSLSLPRQYFGVALPPLRATRTLRFAVAAAGSVAYGLLWAAGVGSHELVFLAVLPFPFLLAISFGYAGALNATGGLALEGRISIAESALTLGATAALFPVMSPVASALVALTAVRGLATVARALALRRRPQSEVPQLDRLVRGQGRFLASTAAIVLHGQLDLVVLGFFTSFGLIGVYGPLARTAYSAFLVAEGLTLAMYSLEHERGSWLARRWRWAGLGLGIGLGAAFLALARPVLELILDEPVHHLGVPILLFALLIPVRFYGYVQSVDLVRAGRQAARIPALIAGIAVLLAGAVAGGLLDSITWLASFRLASEVVVSVGFFYMAHRFSVRLAPAPAPLQPE